jgi:hypothetical protein
MTVMDVGEKEDLVHDAEPVQCLHHLMQCLLHHLMQCARSLQVK